jgi:hypothetical protein
MREFLVKLFEMSHFDTGICITPFSPAHIAYILLIFGGIAIAYTSFRHKDASAKEKLLRLLAYSLAFSYFSDFFFHEFVYGGLNSDKLPFHACTVLCPLVLVSQFHHRGSRIKEPVAMLAIVAPLMYLCYPASVGDGEPWCYQAVQTMFFHGVLLGWGVLNLALGVVKPQVRHIWKCGVLLGCITLWAKLGNTMMPQHNWFFLEEDAFYIGLVANAVIPKWSLMILNPIVFFMATLLVYAVVCPLQKKSRCKVW